MNLNGQIRKLDKDINVCKAKLTTLFKQTKLAEEKPKMKTTGDRYRYRKNYHEDCVPEIKKDLKGCKPAPRKMVVSHDALKRPRTMDEHIVTQVQLKGLIKPRSRSVCSVRPETSPPSPPRCRYEQPVEPPCSRSSWANILREHHHRCSEDDYQDYERPRSRNPERIVPVQSTIHVRNRGVQCSEKILNSVERPNSGNLGDCQSGNTNYLSAQSGTAFAPYNPARTLQFLVFEFKENLRNKTGDNKLLSIVNDMEDIVMRLRFDPDSCLTSVDPKPDHKAEYDDLRIKLTDKYQRLEATSKTMELLCTKLKEEKKLLSLELDAKKEALKSCDAKENEYLSQISMLNNHIQSLNQRSEQQNQSVQELTKVLNKLQADAKVYNTLREQHGKMSAKLEMAEHEIDKLQTECQLLKLDKEKAELLLDIKKQQLHRLKDDLKNVGVYVNGEMQTVHDRVVSGDSSVDNTEPLCSSPNDSGHSLRQTGVYPSWRHVSAISAGGEEGDFVLGARNCPSATPFVQMQKTLDPLQPSDNMRRLKQELKTIFCDLRKEALALPPSRSRVPSVSTEDDGSVHWEQLGVVKSPTSVASKSSFMSAQ